MTNLELIATSLRLIGVLSEGETPSAEQGSDALNTMNDLFAQWDGNDIDIGHFHQTDINATSPIFADAMQAAKYNLAIALAGEYAVEPRGAVVVTAVSSYQRLVRDSVIAQQEPADMSHISGGTQIENIENG